MQQTKFPSKALLGFALAALLAVVTALQAGSLSANDREFLAGYERVRAALAADDLAGAKSAGKSLGPPFGFTIWNSRNLDEARRAFGKMSAHAVKIAVGQPGYYVIHCPMLNKDWVQTSRTVANPYGGKDMVSCGEIKK
jgi:hypothetical protein